MFKKLVYLKKFNNYYNRIIKKYSTVDDYKTNSDAFYEAFNVNFNPADGVSTAVTMSLKTSNNEQIPSDFVFSEWTPDYVLVTHDEIVNEETNTIIDSRWFIIEAEFQSKGVYKLQLRRDVIADNLENLLEAPIYVEKASLSSDNPLIYNSEGMSFNQIKTNELLLKDKSKSPWIVVYVADEWDIGEKWTESSGEQTKEIIKASISGKTVNASVKSISQNYIDAPAWFNPNNSSLKILNNTEVNLSSFLTIQGTVHSLLVTSTENRGSIIKFNNLNNLMYENDINLISYSGFPVHTPSLILEYNDIANDFRDIMDSNYPNRALYLKTKLLSLSDSDLYDLFETTFKSKIDSILSTNNINKIDIEYYTNKIIKYNNKYYKINSFNFVNNTTENYILNNISSSIQNSIVDTIKNNTSVNTSLISNSQYSFSNKDIPAAVSYGNYYINIQEVDSINVSLAFPTETPGTTEMVHANDAPYYILAMPYSNISIKDEEDNLIECNKEAALKIALSLVPSLGSGSIYDVQLLPYCPVPEMIDDSDDEPCINLYYGNSTGININYVKIKDSNDTTRSICLFASESKQTFNIPVNITLPVVSENESINIKVSNECDMYRLSSPNYNGQFEFSLAKNGGSINYFNVDIMFKPQTPYIHINPDFKGLYGNDFNDSRGLICGGDFSLPQVSNAFTEYELQNKNFQNIFDRQIQSLDLQQKYQRVENIAGAIGGTAIGAATGGLTGGIPGAIAGGILSTAGGASDLYIKDKLMQDQRSLQVDMYNYNLGNIAAMPNSLTKISAFTNNNKIFPVFEYYTCTDEEKSALIKKIKYDGMTVMKISSLSEFINSEFIRGKLIRCDNISDDFHIVNECYNELAKGLYLK